MISVTAAFSQTEGEDMWRIETTDGSIYIGMVQKSDGEVVVLETKNIGIIRIPRAEIVLMTKGDSEVVYRNKKLESSSFSHSRYFFSPNSYNMKKGEGYYHNFMVFVNQASYGINDYISIGAGLVPLFLFDGTSSPFWITPKVSIPIVENKFNLGAGALLGTIIGEDAGVAGIAYGLATYGSRESNINLGVGYGFIDGETTESAIINLSGMTNVSRRTTLMFESYLIYDVFIVAAGGRTNLGKVSLDYGLFTAFEGFAFPLLGLVIPFK
jgi:hypothetical protein